MRYLFLIIISLFVLASCSTKSELIYLNADKHTDWSKKINDSTFNDNINPGDILKIDIQTIVPEAAFPFNNTLPTQSAAKSIDVLKLEGYLVDQSKMISFQVLGKISVKDLNINQLENKITRLLVDGGHLTNPTVKIRRLNFKFTVLGEVNNPGTFSFFEEKLNLFQAIGYAGGLTIVGKRKDLTVIREENGLRKIYKTDLTNSNVLFESSYQVKNNDVIIINPNYSKVKSAGFIGSPSSIASISSIILSITLLLINN